MVEYLAHFKKIPNFTQCISTTYSFALKEVAVMDIFAIVLSLVLLMYFAYRGVSVLILAPVLAILAVVLSGVGSQSMGMYTQIFMEGMGSFAVKYFPLFLLGAIFGKLMQDSGYAYAIAKTLVTRLGDKHAMLSVVLACAILTYGGVSAFVVTFAIYPIAAALFRHVNIPKRLIPGAICIGALTLTMTALPGTPSIHNAIPMPYFETDAFAAWIRHYCRNNYAGWRYVMDESPTSYCPCE